MFGFLQGIPAFLSWPGHFATDGSCKIKSRYFMNAFSIDQSIGDVRQIMTDVILFFCQIKSVVVNPAAANRNQTVIPGKFLQKPNGWFQLGLERYWDFPYFRPLHHWMGWVKYFQYFYKDSGSPFPTSTGNAEG
jgi:hypothetical protein